MAQAENTPKATFDNQIRTASVAQSQDEKTVETFLLGADQILVGVEDANNQEIIEKIAPDGSTKYKIARNKVEGVEIYNLNKQAHHCWLLIDLETGGRGWYPGSKEVVDIQDAVVYEAADDASSILGTITEIGTYNKLDLVYGATIESTAQVVYCKIQYHDSTIGYVKNNSVKKTYFIDRT